MSDQPATLSLGSGRVWVVRRLTWIAPGALVCTVVAVVAWFILGLASRVVPVQPGTRLLGVSGGAIYWLGRTCSLWQTRLEGAHAPEALEPLMWLAECPPDDPRIDGDVVYHLSGQGNVTRHAPGQRHLLLERNLAYALALDRQFLYVGNCAERANCKIERLHAEDDPGDPILLQAGILALANMEVDAHEIFWVDRGRRKPDCTEQRVEGQDAPVPHCREPVPPRLMAAPKDPPRATERVVLANFDGRRPLLGAKYVYWLGAGGVHRAPKSGAKSGGAAGGMDELVLPTRTLSGFAADGDDVFFAVDGGVFRAHDGDAPRRMHGTASPPRGVAVDAGYVYWIDGDDNAVIRQRR